MKLAQTLIQTAINYSNFHDSKEHIDINCHFVKRKSNLSVGKKNIKTQ